MSEDHGKDDPQAGDAARDTSLTGQKKEQALAHLAFLQRELMEAEASAGSSVHIDLLVEANQRLVVAALSAPAHASVAGVGAEEAARLHDDLCEANEHLVIAALHAQKLQAHAEQALARQKGALASVAHEMRNPLMPISILAERMVKTPPEKLPAMCALIEGQVQHLSRMVEDLLDVSRVSTGKLRLNCAEVDLTQIVKNAADSCAILMSARHLSFDVHIPQTPLSIHGDPVRLTQIITNLLANAAKFTRAGGTVRLHVSATAEAVDIVVSDNGIGISASALPTIFDPYVQDAQAVHFNGSGLGIGLTVVRELVEAHGGVVSASSEGSGKGSQFVIRLPLLPPSDSTAIRNVSQTPSK